MTIPLSYYLAVAAIMFLAGLWAVMTRRNAVWILMGIELILNSASLNFVAFSRHVPPALSYPADGGMAASIFIILLAAAEAAVALAILIAIYRNFGTIETKDLQELKG